MGVESAKMSAVIRYRVLKIYETQLLYQLLYELNIIFILYRK